MVSVTVPVDSVKPKTIVQSAPIFALTSSINTTGTGVAPVMISRKRREVEFPGEKTRVIQHRDQHCRNVERKSRLLVGP